MSRQRLPDPDAWAAHDDPLARLHEGLVDIYRYYRSETRMRCRHAWRRIVSRQKGDGGRRSFSPSQIAIAYAPL
jgi:hypothetical protein